MEELINLRSQFVTSSLRNEIVHGGIRYLPYVLTEQGIMMLSGLLKSDVAAKVNVQIIDAFVAMRKFISSTMVNQSFINNLVYSANMNEKLIKKYKSQYNNVELVFNNRFHDRFIIIDNKCIYHCGSSFKDLGKKCFAINKIESNKILNDVLDEIRK